MSLKTRLVAATALSLITASASLAETIVIATVNNGDMIRMQGYTDDFTAKTGHQVEWVTLEENVLRQRVTTDISTKGGAFDILTIGMSETHIRGANGKSRPGHARRAGLAVHTPSGGSDDRPRQ